MKNNAEYYNEYNVIEKAIQEMPSLPNANIELENRNILSNFISIASEISAEIKEASKTLLESIRFRRLRFLFPYIFNPVPSVILANVYTYIKPKGPVKINIKERIYIKNDNEKSNYQQIFENILDTYIYPFNIESVTYKYEQMAISMTLSGPSFLLNCDFLQFWINYKSDVQNSIKVYELIKTASEVSLKIKYSDNVECEYRSECSFLNKVTSIHPNLITKIRLNYPNVFNNLYIKIPPEIDKDKEIISIVLDIPITSAITKYDLKRVFHLNTLSFISTHEEYSQVIVFDGSQDNYPIIHPDGTDYIPLEVKEVSIRTGDQISIIKPSFCTTHESGPVYMLIPPMKQYREKYYRISCNASKFSKFGELTAFVEWCSTTNHDPAYLNLSFCDRKINYFNFSIVEYNKYIGYEDRTNSVLLLDYLRMKNLKTLKKDDFITLLNALIYNKSVYQELIEKIEGVDFNNKSLTFFLIFSKECESIEKKDFLTSLCSYIEEFINNNLVLDSVIKVKPCLEEIHKG